MVDLGYKIYKGSVSPPKKSSKFNSVGWVLNSQPSAFTKTVWMARQWFAYHNLAHLRDLSYSLRSFEFSGILHVTHYEFNF